MESFIMTDTVCPTYVAEVYMTAPLSSDIYPSPLHQVALHSIIASALPAPHTFLGIMLMLGQPLTYILLLQHQGTWSALF